MAYGVEIRDNAGNIVVSVTDRLTKLLGTVSITANGSLTLPGTLTGNNYWFTFEPTGGGFPNTPPFIGISSGTLYWSYPASGTHQPGIIHYGMY